MSAFADVEINATNFPDSKFREYVSGFDQNGNGILGEKEIADVDRIYLPTAKISSLKGIEFFTALENLDCQGTSLTTLDLSKNTALEYVNCRYCSVLVSLVVSNCTALKELYCDYTEITNLDVSNSVALEKLNCEHNQLTELDLSNNTALKSLECQDNQITSLDVSKNVALEKLDCGNNQLTELDLSRNSSLEFLSCYGNQLVSLDVSGCTALTYLDCGSIRDNYGDLLRNNSLTTLDVSNNVALEDLRCGDNQLASLDLSNNSALRNLTCAGNKLVSLDLSSNSALEELWCGDNQLTSLDLSNNLLLDKLSCSYNQLTKLDLSKNIDLTYLNCEENQLTELDLSKNTALKSLVCYGQESPTLRYVSQNDGTYHVNLKDYVSDPGRIVNIWLESGNTGTYSYNKENGILTCTEAPSSVYYEYDVKSVLDVTMNVTLTKQQKPTIITESLTEAAQGVKYSHMLEASGEDGMTWILTEGKLPSGLSLSESGTISGTTTELGSFDFTVKVSNEYGTDSKEFTLQVLTVKITITPESLADSGAGAKYNATLQASGGTSPYTWSISDGSLPTGLTLDESKGKISGTPSQKGTYSFEVKVTDNNGITATKTYTIMITGPEISGTLSAGVLKAAYSGTLTATGGTTPYTWTMSGSAPKGLKIDKKTGKISGKPTKAGTFTFEVKVTDKNKATATAQYTITISEPEITGTLADNGKVAAQYNGQLHASGGTYPYTWTKSGSLPKGLTLNKTTGELSGRPTKAGKFTFKIKATDKNKASVTKAFTITITAPVISGTLNSNTTLEATYEGQLTATGGTEPYTWSISSGKFPPGLTSDASTGTFSGRPNKAGKYSFKVRVTDANGAVFTTKSLRITVTAPKISGTLKGGTTGVQYSGTLKATGGIAPYKWIISGGMLPVGLDIDENAGTISGTPEQPGTYKFTVRAEDANGGAAEKSYKLKIKKGKNSSVKSSNEVYDENSEPESEKMNSEDETALSNEDDVVSDETEKESSEKHSYSATELYVSSDDVVSQGEDRDNDLVIVRSNEPLRFTIGTWPREVSEESVYVDDEAVEGIEIENGRFTLPADMIHDDFKVGVKANAEDSEIETEELYISAEE